MNFVYKGKPPAAPAGSFFLAKWQLLKTSSPAIANGGGMETETDVQSGQVARGGSTDPNELGVSPSFLKQKFQYPVS